MATNAVAYNNNNNKNNNNNNNNKVSSITHKTNCTTTNDNIDIHKSSSSSSSSTTTTTSSFHIPDISIILLSYPYERVKRMKINEMKGWEKHGLTKLFSKTFIPPEVNYTLLIEIQIKSYDMKIKLTPYLQSIVDDNLKVLGINNNNNQDSNNNNDNTVITTHLEEWLISAINGYGRIRDLAITEPYCSLSLQPFVTIAAPISNKAQLIRYDISPLTGICYRSSYPTHETYLPFHIEGNFIVSKQIELFQR